MSLVSDFTRELGRAHLPTASQVSRRPSSAGASSAGDGVASDGISESELRARASRSSDETAAETRAGAAARRIAAGHVGDPLALDGYVERARRVAGLSLGAGGVMAALALAVDPLGWLPASLLALGAGLDWARGRLGARVLIQGGALVIRRGPWGGTRLRRNDIASIDIESIGLGARGRSHLVVIRLEGNCPLRLEGSGPRRLIVPEAGVGEARAAARRLRQWWSSPRGAQCSIGSNASQAASIAVTACAKKSE